MDKKLEQLEKKVEDTLAAYDAAALADAAAIYAALNKAMDELAEYLKEQDND